MHHATAYINLDAIRANALLAKNLAPESQLICVVKANAYGHGALPVAMALMDSTDAFAVATMAEALELRSGGISKPIILLEGILEPEFMAVVAEAGLWPTVHTIEQLEWVEDNSDTPLDHVILKVDTGMHRLGFPLDEAPHAIERLLALDTVGAVTLATHFANADELGRATTAKQIQAIQDLADRYNLPISMSNSPSLMGVHAASAEWNRAGFMLYGGKPFAGDHPVADQLQVVTSLTAPVIALRDIPVGDSVGYGHNWTATRPSKIATLGIGYADGYPRVVAAGTAVAFGDYRLPIVGNISMDMITVDVTDVDHIALGDEVELYGATIPVNEVANAAGTIGYEIMTSLGRRVERIYISESCQ